MKKLLLIIATLAWTLTACVALPPDGDFKCLTPDCPGPDIGATGSDASLTGDAGADAGTDVSPDTQLDTADAGQGSDVAAPDAGQDTTTDQDTADTQDTAQQDADVQPDAAPDTAQPDTVEPGTDAAVAPDVTVTPDTNVQPDVQPVDKCAGVICDDKNPCTDVSCDQVTGGCVAVNNTVPCSDGDVCTTGDTCQDGACEGGAAKKCDDGNPCTEDTCDKAVGCVFDKIPDQDITVSNPPDQASAQKAGVGVWACKGKSGAVATVGGTCSKGFFKQTIFDNTSKPTWCTGYLTCLSCPYPFCSPDLVTYVCPGVP